MKKGSSGSCTGTKYHNRLAGIVMPFGCQINPHNRSFRIYNCLGGGIHSPSPHNRYPGGILRIISRPASSYFNQVNSSEFGILSEWNILIPADQVLSAACRLRRGFIGVRNIVIVLILITKPVAPDPFIGPLGYKFLP